MAVTSEITGPMVVEDVVYENADGDQGSKNSLRVDHKFLGSSYHSSIISGLSLVASSLSAAASSGEKVSITVVGLGAGCFPMFLRGCLPFVDIEVVELDPLVAELAEKYFGFSMDEQLKVHLGDGIKFIEDSVAANQSVNGSTRNAFKILILDVDSSDLSSGLSCPPENFVEDPFLLIAKEFLLEGGLFVINLVSRSASVRETVVSRLKAVFEHLYSLQLEEDINEVLFASPSGRFLEINDITAGASKLQDLLKIPVDVESDIQKLQKLQ
ncbi:Methyltransferase-like protein 13 [Zea mays]|uniref:Methyltransferase-like protein 13 n=1 Tax=Zea mays TaxID=4577 RepID=A0A3L6G5X4_MAIZE|nr:Methyltransferase-like protein 13 [Zea mays]